MDARNTFPIILLIHDPTGLMKRRHVAPFPPPNVLTTPNDQGERGRKPPNACVENIQVPLLCYSVNTLVSPLGTMLSSLFVSFLLFGSAWARPVVRNIRSTHGTCVVVASRRHCSSSLTHTTFYRIRTLVGKARYRDGSSRGGRFLFGKCGAAALTGWLPNNPARRKKVSPTSFSHSFTRTLAAPAA